MPNLPLASKLIHKVLLSLLWTKRTYLALFGKNRQTLNCQTATQEKIWLGLQKKIWMTNFLPTQKKFLRHFYFWPFIQNDSLKLRSFIGWALIRSGWKPAQKSSSWRLVGFLGLEIAMSFNFLSCEPLRVFCFKLRLFKKICKPAFNEYLISICSKAFNAFKAFSNFQKRFGPLHRKRLGIFWVFLFSVNLFY